MVLTLLPGTVLTASAAPAQDTPDNVVKSTDADGTKHYFYEKSATGTVTSVTVTRCSTAPGDGREVGKWYWEDNVNKLDNKSVFYEVTSGIITGNNGSGTWYPANGLDFVVTNASTGAKSLRSNTFTLLGTGTDLSVGAAGETWSNLTLNVDIAGTGALTLGSWVTNATVTSKYVFAADPTGTVNVTARDHSGYNTTAPNTNGLVLSATNVNVTVGKQQGRTNNLTLTNCKLTGDVDLDGEYTTDAKGTKGYNNQTLTVTGGSVASTIALSNTTPNVSLTNCSGVSTVTYTGTNGGSFTVAGTTSTSGAFEVTPRTKDSTYPKVDINGGTVAGITQKTTASNGDANGNSITVGINNSGASVGASGVTIEKGTLNIASGKVNGAVAVKEGTLKVSGSGVSITGMTTLGANGSTDLDISATGSSFGGIEVASGMGGNLKKVTWPTGRGNSYGTLDLGSYAGNGVKGGKFAVGSASDFGDDDNMNWFDKSLQFYSVLKSDSTKIGLYGKDELAVAIAESNDPDDGTSGGGIAVLGQVTGATTLTLMNGKDTWAKIGYNTTTGFVLPTQINTVKVGSWVVDSQDGTLGDGNQRVFVAGTEEAISCPANGMVLNANPNGTSVTADELTNAENGGVGTVENGDVKVTLNGRNINLSGAVTYTAGGYATVKVKLTTNVLNTTSGQYETLDVDVLWNVEKKTFQFDKSKKLGLGAIIDANGDLVLNNGVGAHYTVGGNLAVSAPNLEIVDQTRAASPIVGAVGGSLSSRNQAQKDALIKAIQTDSEFDYSDSPAFRQAVNAAQASITSKDTVNNWINTAQTTVWRSGYKSPDTSKNTNAGYYPNMAPHSTNFANVAAGDTDKTQITTKLNTAYIVPYLLITATNETQTGELTLTVQPYYRVDVSAAPYSSECYYTVQAGRALSALTGDMGTGVVLTLPLADLTNVTKTYMHQDGKYVYTLNTTYTITHAGANGTLGTMVLNGTDGLITATKKDGTTDVGIKYDDLQAAIDDTEVEARAANGTISSKAKVTVPGGYTGSCNVTMTGYARTIDVELQGLQTLTWSGAALDVTKDDASGIYTLQLKRDTAPTGGNITITGVTGGTASVSANPATAGSTVTITLNPAAGYTAAGVSVKDGSGNTVSVSGSGTRYTFTMPSGTATVTPSFTQNQTARATVTVTNPSRGSGSASTTAGSSQVTPGTLVTVSTSPASGQRTMGLSVSGGATATRTGVNQFQFYVPSNVSNVTVTPSFDTDNGTVFSDVWSSEYYSPAVAWAVGRGVTNGTSTYLFSPNNSCTREDMVTFLYRAAGSPAVGNVTNPFWDVQPGSYYYNAVMWAVSKGITNGVSANQFGVGQTVSRAQAVTFLYRYENSPSASTNSGFYDVNSREYYARAVTWAKNKGVTDGTSPTMFSPNDPCLRGQIVTFLYRNTIL